MTSLVNRVVHWSAKNRSQSQSPPQADLCEICGKKPKFVDKGFKHPYCSRSCARNGQGPSPNACLLQGCRATGKPAFHNFCTDAHAREGVQLGQVEACDLCRIQPRAVEELCLSCMRQAGSSPRLRELSNDKATYKNLRAQFLSEWESPDSTPKFEKAYEIMLPRDVRARHEAYRIHSQAGEDIRTFHSSQCICDLGFKNATLCNFKSCGICSIIKSSFSSFAFGVPHNNGRFGNGIYSFRSSNLADRFSTSCTSSPYRVMIACDTAIASNQSPVVTADEVSEEESLFVPVADAILPTYVIVYTA